jgi:flavin-dependent dehydrogenase
MFETMAEQAKGLLESGHTVPAAVLGRIVLERWLRDQAEKAGIEVAKDAKASMVNESLKRASIFTTPKWRQVQVYLDIGNAAAHGDEKGFTRAEVEKLLEFIEANCA